MKGWDFSYLETRWECEDLPWDYREIIFHYKKESHRLLDMGTGGGEFLLTLNHPHDLTSVTEAYPPNLELCRERLSPLGIEIRQIFKDSAIPYEDLTFDIIINRHESFDAREVSRILKPGGFFITQQVGGTNTNDLAARLIDGFTPQFLDHTLKNCSKELEDHGLTIIFSHEIFPRIRFFDTGALVYYASIIEWEFPSFSLDVDSCLDNLCKLEEEIQERSYIEGREHRFIIVTKKLST